MDQLINIFNVLFTVPITNLLVGFYQLFNFFGFPSAFALAIVALSILIKMILIPFTAAQIKSASKMQKVAPHVALLKEKHKGDAKRLQEETMKLYKEHGVNPMAGCLPLLVQLPVIWALYHVLITAVSVSGVKDIAAINSVLYFDFLKLDSVWNTTLFGVSLGKSPSALMATVPLIILVPLLTGLFQFLLSKMMLPEETLVPSTTAVKKQDDFQAAFQKQSLFIFPVMIGFISFTLPLGLSIYWNTFTIFGIIQQYFVAGPGAARPWFERVIKPKEAKSESKPTSSKKSKKKKK